MTRTPPLRIVPGLIAAALTFLLCLTNAVRFVGDAPVFGTVLLIAAALWLAVFAVTQNQSPVLLAKCAVAGLAFYAAIGIASLFGAPPFAGEARLFTALSIEGLMMFSAVLIAANIPFFWKRSDQNV